MPARLRRVVAEHARFYGGADPSYRTAAGRVGAEMREAPTVGELLATLAH